MLKRGQAGSRAGCLKKRGGGTGTPLTNYVYHPHNACRKEILKVLLYCYYIEIALIILINYIIIYYYYIATILLLLNKLTTECVFSANNWLIKQLMAAQWDGRYLLFFRIFMFARWKRI